MNKYSNIDGRNRQHIITLINWIIDEVISAGGDGDALWYSKYYSIDDIYLLLKEIGFKHEWKIEKHEDYISLSLWQEGIIITNNQKHWDEAPSWEQVMIRY